MIFTAASEIARGNAATVVFSTLAYGIGVVHLAVMAAWILARIIAYVIAEWFALRSSLVDSFGAATTSATDHRTPNQSIETVKLPD